MDISFVSSREPLGPDVVSSYATSRHLTPMEVIRDEEGGQPWLGFEVNEKEKEEK